MYKPAFALQMTAAGAEGTGSQEAAICKGCGRPEGPIANCNGEGRVVGGMSAIVQWWPIKAYRPCPDFVAADKTYVRSGQSLEEIAFGRKGASDDKSLDERLKGK